ncbi:hypothetical protein J6590_001624 [Homalodisca vitripennis]|nr:hypothetical protein J6590_001624 [Homalodisca vitripennis]
MIDRENKGTEGRSGTCSSQRSCKQQFLCKSDIKDCLTTFSVKGGEAGSLLSFSRAGRSVWTISTLPSSTAVTAEYFPTENRGVSNAMVKPCYQRTALPGSKGLPNGNTGSQNPTCLTADRIT